MYVLIDMEQCAITHIHHSRQVLNALAWIECKNAAKVIPLGDPRLFAKALTPYEMLKVYQNATGVELKAYGNTMATVLHEMAKRMPESDCDEVEVLRHATMVLPADPNSYRYVKGTVQPEHLPGLFQRPPIKVAAQENEVAAATQALTAYTQVAATASKPPPALPNHTGAPVPPLPKEYREPRAPRSGSTRPLVFEVADAMWKAAGSPMDAGEILRLRKDIMVKLENEHNIKRTTSSVTLGDWQKQLLSI